MPKIPAIGAAEVLKIVAERGRNIKGEGHVEIYENNDMVNLLENNGNKKLD